MGPFYCPLDKKVYIDLVFFEELKRRFKAPGEFAQAYVVAHEVGHHVQTLLGVSDKVRDAQQRDPRRANEMQVRMELQADCLAGVWANRTNQMKQRLEPGDIESGPARGSGDRRRHPAAAVDGSRGAGELHARQLGAARALVHQGLRERARCKPATPSVPGRSSHLSSRNAPQRVSGTQTPWLSQSPPWVPALCACALRPG